MRDYLLDIVSHTHGLGVIDKVKIVGTKDKTEISAYDQETKTVILDAEFKNPIAEFIGTFGLPNLGRLNTILNIPEYQTDAKISVFTKANDPTVPEGIAFENKNGNFKNVYRFMSEAMIVDQLKNIRMKAVNWNIDIVPTVDGIQKLKFQSQAHADVTAFSSKVENGHLKFYFGDHSSHAGNFIFAADCGSKSAKQLYWPTTVFNNIFSLPGDKTLKISDDGVAEITVDSGLAVYQYKIPALSK